MTQAGESRGRATGWRCKSIGLFLGWRPGGACGSAGLPELAEISAQFLSCRSPVCFDTIAELGHVALEFEFVLLQP